MFKIKTGLFILVSIFYSTSFLCAADDGLPDLFSAIENANLEQVDELLLNGANPNEVRVNRWFDAVENQWEVKIKTPLYACFSAEIPTTYSKVIFDKLVRYKADVNMIDPDEMSPLLRTIRDKDFSSLMWLLDNGALPEQRNKFGESPLSKAITRDCESLYFQNLLKKIKDKNAINEKFAPHPVKFLLVQTLRKKRIDLTRLLLKYGADCNIQDAQGNGVLHDVTIPLHPRGVSLLLKEGLDPNLCDKIGRTGLDYAVDRDILVLLQRCCIRVVR